MEKKLESVNIVFLIAIIILLLINVVFYFVYKNTETEKTNVDVVEDKISILIDPGHGGVDSGAVNKYGEHEAFLNLKISKYLMSFLDSTGFNVEMTRYTDDALYNQGANTTIREKKNEDLKNRVELINNSNADIVVSIHLNAFSQDKYYGAQTFYKAKDENSKKAAQIIQKNMKNILDKNNNRVPQIKRDVRIIDCATKPIVLVECGFVSNPTESKLLCTKEYQEKVAWAIYSGLLEYFSGK
ncbi:N-acetylmuramoyl-L-alanine amidase [Sedimentibacter sp. zth1]|uniref:N-acetylmuramoyl-L-alanine amidase n=1 Tax=Sedimentibacter sp. zth1 TaxID=2816908 RepID=UPI001A910AEB|nr:N-acetylmuramoyl-L-alanine amidase [Sedimentibacter sp. zth1]QSX06974.1 N-acetylmuramoyl-L-alanine amidase [Sedimentibacter sp. zth1]